MIMNKTECTVCEKFITNNNYKKHITVCGNKTKKSSKSLICEFCHRQFESSVGSGIHRSQCTNNPEKKPNWNIGREAWNKGTTKETNDIVANQAQKAKDDYATGKRKLSGFVTRTTEELSRIAKASNCGGYRENAGRSKKFRVPDSYGKIVTLQSTYELRCAEILNELSVKWIRPKSMKYDERLYYPDFYLVDYGIFLDPKNSYKARLDEAKISKAAIQNNAIIHILTNEKLTKEYISSLI